MAECEDVCRTSGMCCVLGAWHSPAHSIGFCLVNSSGRSSAELRLSQGGASDGEVEVSVTMLNDLSDPAAWQLTEFKLTGNGGSFEFTVESAAGTWRFGLVHNDCMDCLDGSVQRDGEEPAELHMERTISERQEAILCQLRRIFDSIDADRNESLCRNEVFEFMKKMAEVLGSADQIPMEQSEIDSEIDKVFGPLDADMDGKLTFEEALAMVPSEVIAVADNSSHEEFEGMLEMYTKIADGCVSGDLSAALAAM